MLTTFLDSYYELIIDGRKHVLAAATSCKKRKSLGEVQGSGIDAASVIVNSAGCKRCSFKESKSFRGHRHSFAVSKTRVTAREQAPIVDVQDKRSVSTWRSKP